MNKTLITCALITASSTTFAAVSELSYNYVEATAAIGKFSVRTAGKTFDYKTPTFSAQFSYELDEDYFVTLGHSQTTVDKSDNAGGVILTLDGTMKQTGFTLGYAYSLQPTTDLTFQIGGAHSSNDIDGRFTPSGIYQYKKSTNNLIWDISLRTLWPEYSFEGYVGVVGQDDDLGLKIGGPMYLTDNLAVDINYLYFKKREKSNSSTLSSLGLSIRKYF